MKRKMKRSVGDLVSVPLGDGTVGFGWLLNDPLVAFLDHRAAQAQSFDVDAIVEKPVAFRVWVLNRPIVDGTWPVVGHAPVPAALCEAPSFFKQDPITRKLTITRGGHEGEVPAGVEQCRLLERAAVWDPEHIVDRLRDHFAGRPNQWVESLRLKQ